LGSGKVQKNVSAAGKQRQPLFNEVEVRDRVWELAEPMCDAEGLELVHIEYRREAGGRILRIFIDKTGGVHLDDCAAVSRQLGDLLDVYLDEIGPYNLEVSSPGLDRPLGRETDFERFKGCEAKIRTHHLLDGQKNFTGALMGMSEGSVRLKMDSKVVAIPFSEIQKARLINFNGEYPCL
jgi:ribosome maturation factor RimP